MAETFAEVEKDGVRLVVHPSTVEAHKRHGWKIIAEGVSAPKSGKEKTPEPPKDAEGKKPEPPKGDAA